MKKFMLVCIIMLVLIGCKKQVVKVAPSVNSVPSTSSITATTATIGGTISDDGGDPITARGVVYGLTPNPTISDSKTSDGTGIGTFTSNISGLLPGKTYYFRTYATNSIGTSYGDQITLTTTKVAPSLTAGTTTSTITTTSAVISGSITADGGDAITARGVVYGLNPNPTLTDNKTTDGSGIGNFTSTVTGLTPGKVYYFRTYATNSVGTTYGDQITLTSPAVLATVATTVVTSVTSATATSGGSISTDGGAAITAKGVCWSIAANPTTALTTKTTDGTGTTTFTSALTGLSPNTPYYVRAYATNSVGTNYGSQVTFTTLAAGATVTTASITAITSTTATGGGNVTLDGGVSVTARGVCWSTTTGPTTALTTKTSDNSGTGTFTSLITGLSPGTAYYVRAYATNSVATTYGAEVTFNALAVAPTVTTTALTNLTSTSATGGGNVTSTGGATVTESGLCWGTTTTPTTSNTKLALGSGLGSFTGSITGLTAGVNYYVRAYATNSAGTSYGTAMIINGLTSDINNLIPQSYIDELKRLGMPINTGFTPPDVTCIFSVTPFLLKGTNIPNDYAIGYKFADQRIQFSQQDNTKLTVKIDYVSGSSGSTTTSTGSFLVGSGNKFTIFSKTVTTASTGVTTMVSIFSGTIASTSILEFYEGIVMVDNGGDSVNYIDNGEGRVFWDSDGVSEKVSSLKSAHINIGTKSSGEK